jgi:hypothetical protein
MNILVKLMSMVSIVFAGLIVSYSLHVESINPPFSKVKLDTSKQNRVEWISQSDYELMQAEQVTAEEALADSVSMPVNTTP